MFISYKFTSRLNDNNEIVSILMFDIQHFVIASIFRYNIFVI